MKELVRTATFAGRASYVRVPDPHKATDVRRALEAGAAGLVRITILAGFAIGTFASNPSAVAR
jgi:hypothetical protein